jgi:hypothetical protein
VLKTAAIITHNWQIMIVSSPKLSQHQINYKSIFKACPKIQKWLEQAIVGDNG